MSDDGHALDRRSLTLPDWRTVAKKVRRWRPPPPRDYLQLAFALWQIGSAVHDWVGGRPVEVVGDLLFAAAGWRWAWRRELWTTQDYVYICCMFTWLALELFGIVNK